MGYSKHIAVFVTCASEKEASLIAKRLLEERLIACANIIGGVQSHFWWKGKIDSAKESLVIIKTAGKNFSRIKKRIKEIHSYEVPEIIALPLVKGERDYLKWIDSSIKK